MSNVMLYSQGFIARKLMNIVPRRILIALAWNNIMCAITL